MKWHMSYYTPQSPLPIHTKAINPFLFPTISKGAHTYFIICKNKYIFILKFSIFNEKDSYQNFYVFRYNREEFQMGLLLLNHNCFSN